MTYIYIEVLQDNPDRANGYIFNVGNPDNEISVKQLAELMIEVAPLFPFFFKQVENASCTIQPSPAIHVSLNEFVYVHRCERVCAKSTTQTSFTFGLSSSKIWFTYLCFPSRYTLRFLAYLRLVYQQRM